VLVEVGLVLGSLDIGKIVRVQVEVLFADMAAVLVQRSDVVLVF
jgi:hypothetical protein